MIFTNIRMALSSIRTAKTRSILTMLGVIIGVMSVVMTVSVGEGIKNQVINQINKLGNNIVIIKPGKDTDEQNNKLGIFNLNSQIASSTLTKADLDSLQTVPGVASVSPSAIITGEVTSADKSGYNSGVIIATNASMQNTLNQKVEFGQFFDDSDATKDVAVIGSNVAASLYDQRDPIGRAINLKGHEYIIRGVLTSAPENPLNIGPNYNDAIYIPMDSGKKLAGGNIQISEITTRIKDGENIATVSEAIKATLSKNHAGQDDFTLVSQAKYLNFANQIFTWLTTLVAMVAGISLFVGGIGIMNIMLVSVSERTREIGVRKAIGATNQQILSQFLVEATVISVTGGIIGVLLSMLLSFIMRITTSIHPSISFGTIIIATGVSTLVGVIFGMAPAIQAARKDPIVALRHH